MGGGGSNPIAVITNPIRDVISPVTDPIYDVVVAPVVAPVVAIISPPEACEGSWSGYGACDASCGGGTQTKTWTTTTPSAHGGTACPNPATQSQECNTQPCPINCGGTWSDYTPCNETCGGGTQTRTWTTTTLPAHGGTACPSPTMELEECNTQACLTSAGPSAGPSTGPSAESTDNDNKIYIAFGAILSVCCCMLVLVLILSMQGKPRIVRDYL